MSSRLANWLFGTQVTPIDINACRWCRKPMEGRRDHAPIPVCNDCYDHTRVDYSVSPEDRLARIGRRAELMDAFRREAVAMVRKFQDRPTRADFTHDQNEATAEFLRAQREVNVLMTAGDSASLEKAAKLQQQMTERHANMNHGRLSLVNAVTDLEHEDS